MFDAAKSISNNGQKRPELVPRLEEQGYAPDQVAKRRQWVEQKTFSNLNNVGEHSISTSEMRGNIENPIGAVQMPLGVAGPLEIAGQYANGEFYVPMATTEGALVRSYERGMVALTRSGGVTTRVYMDENRVSPVFFLKMSRRRTNLRKIFRRILKRFAPRRKKRRGMENC